MILFGSYATLNSLTNDIKSEINFISQSVKIPGKRRATFEQLKQFIEFHLNLIQLSDLKLVFFPLRYQQIV